MDNSETKAPSKKTGGAKPQNPDKVFLNWLNDTILRPTKRRMCFLYPALSAPNEGLLVLGTNPDKIIFGNPEEGLCMIKFRDPEKLLFLWGWLLSLGMDPYRIECLDLGKIVSSLNKAKGDRSKVIAKRSPADGLLYLDESDKPASADIYSLFTMNRFKYQVDEFLPILTSDKQAFEHALPVIEKDQRKVVRIDIPREQFRDSVIGNVFDSDLRVVASAGYDLLQAFQLGESVRFNGLKFWHADGQALYYAAVIETDECVILSSRCNLFLIPL